MKHLLILLYFLLSVVDCSVNVQDDEQLCLFDITKSIFHSPKEDETIHLTGADDQFNFVFEALFMPDFEWELYQSTCNGEDSLILVELKNGGNHQQKLLGTTKFAHPGCWKLELIRTKPDRFSGIQASVRFNVVFDSTTTQTHSTGDEAPRDSRSSMDLDCRLHFICNSYFPT